MSSRDSLKGAKIYVSGVLLHRFAPENLAKSSDPCTIAWVHNLKNLNLSLVRPSGQQQWSIDSNTPQTLNDGPLPPAHHLPRPALPPTLLLSRSSCLRPRENENHAQLHRPHNRVSRLPRPAHVAESAFRGFFGWEREVGYLHEEGFGKQGPGF